MRTLLVGFGFSATTFHLPFLQYNDGYQVKGVVSSNPAKVNAMISGCPVWFALEDALSEGQFDLVVITTPNHLHAEQAEKAIAAGCHVLVEKPFTLSAADAQSLISKSKAANKHICVYQNRRFDGDFLTVKNLINSGMLGNVKYVSSRFDRFRPHPQDRWRENEGPGSGILWDLGPHLVDQAMVLFGQPEEVSGRIQIRRENGQSDDTFNFWMHYPEFDVHVASSPFVAHSTLRFEVQGDKGSYRKYGLDPQEAQLRKHVSPGDANWGRTVQSDHGIFCGEHSSKQIVTEQGDYKAFYARLLSGLNGDGEIPASAESVLPVIHFIESAYSLNEKQPGKSFSFDFTI